MFVCLFILISLLLLSSSQQMSSNHLHSTRVVAQFELDAFYQDHEPPSLLPRSPSSDPVTRHGHQFRKTFVSQREKEKQKDLFGKVCT